MNFVTRVVLPAALLRPRAADGHLIAAAFPADAGHSREFQSLALLLLRGRGDGVADEDALLRRRRVRRARRGGGGARRRSLLLRADPHRRALALERHLERPLLRRGDPRGFLLLRGGHLLLPRRSPGAAFSFLRLALLLRRRDVFVVVVVDEIVEVVESRRVGGRGLLPLLQRLRALGFDPSNLRELLQPRLFLLRRRVREKHSQIRRAAARPKTPPAVGDRRGRRPRAASRGLLLDRCSRVRDARAGEHRRRGHDRGLPGAAQEAPIHRRRASRSAVRAGGQDRRSRATAVRLLASRRVVHLGVFRVVVARRGRGGDDASARAPSRAPRGRAAPQRAHRGAHFACRRPTAARDARRGGRRRHRRGAEHRADAPRALRDASSDASATLEPARVGAREPRLARRLARRR